MALLPLLLPLLSERMALPPPHRRTTKLESARAASESGAADAAGHEGGDHSDVRKPVRFHRKVLCDLELCQKLAGR
jgi:hypothetical protein